MESKQKTEGQTKLTEAVKTLIDEGVSVVEIVGMLEGIKYSLFEAVTGEHQ